MSQFTCDKCNKIFKRKKNLERHNSRKTPCNAIHLISKSTRQCPNCSKSFKSYQGYSRHVKLNTCKLNKVPNMNINIDKKMINNTQHINNIDTQNNLNVDGSVKLVKFGDENLSYISDDLFKSILGRGFKAVEELVDHSHFHPDHPENHNIYIANIQTDYVVIFNGAKWTINRKEDVFEDIIYAKSDFLCMKFKELMNQMSENDIKKFTNFINQRDEDKTMNKIKGELKLQLYNDRGLPQKLRKQIENNEKEMQTTLKNKKSKKIENTKLKEAIEMMENLDDSKMEKLCNILNSL